MNFRLRAYILSFLFFALFGLSPKSSIYGQQFSQTSNTNHWVALKLPSPGGYGLIIPYFINENMGFIYDLFHGGASYLFRTLDGGKSWKNINFIDSNIFSNQLFFDNETHGYAASTRGLYETIDTGNNWKKVSRDSSYFISVYKSGTRVFAFERDTMGNNLFELISSQDDGKNWDVIIPWRPIYTHPYILGNRDSFLCTLNLDSIGNMRLWYSTNNGDSWSSNIIDTSFEKTQGFYCFPHCTNILRVHAEPADLSSISQSSDFGATWTKPTLTDEIGLWISGNACALYVSLANENSDTGIYRSTDAGLTWIHIIGPDFTELDDRNYINLAIVNAGAVVYAADIHGNLWKSTDGGDGTLPQGQLNTIKYELLLDSGTTCDNFLTRIFIQHSACNNRKLSSLIIEGLDSTEYRTSINQSFYCGDHLDTLFINITPKTSGKRILNFRLHFIDDEFYSLDTNFQITIYVHTIFEKKFSSMNFSFPLTCAVSDSVLTFSCYDSCSGTQAKLVSADLSGSPNYSLKAPFDSPRTIHTNDSIVIHYDPRISSSDNAVLHLKFQIGSQDFDTTINLLGANRAYRKYLSTNDLQMGVHGCKTSDSIITISFSDSCSGLEGTLVDGSIAGSINFSLLSPSLFPRSLHDGDSLLISYHPQDVKKDTASLLLHFQLGDMFFDTTIQLFGSGRIQKETVRFISSSFNYSAIAGSIVDIQYKPDRLISGRGLDSIFFDLNFDSDLLDYRSITTGIPGANIVLIPLPFYRAMVLIWGKDLSLDPGIPIATVKLLPMVARSMATPIIMTNLKLNNGDLDFMNCILSADTTNTSFFLIAQCGDSTLSRYLNGQMPMKIISLHPNPAQDEIVIDVVNPVGQVQSAPTIFDALGEKVYSEIKNLPSGQSSIHLPIHDLAQGVYFVRVGDVGRSFVKVK
jgi:photosystem II stability/assembly factor-like uncharacterized protein